MKGPAPFLQQAVIHDFLGEGMLEGMDRLREELRLVEELRRLEVRQALLQYVLRQPCQPV
jgi:hypothetical protein